MSIGSALGAAMSGLAATSRQAAAVSSNIANAMTEGYGRRELALSVAPVGAGVRVDAERRIVDTALLSDHRLATAGSAAARASAGFQAGVEGALGVPGDPASLIGRIASFEGALVAATARPESNAALAQVLDTANEVTRAFATASDTIRSARETADRSIGSQVERLNAGLAEVETLNREILRLSSGNQPASAQMDQRQRVIDQIADILPLRQIERTHGQVLLYTDSGMVLLESRASRFEFTASPVIDPGMTLASGALSSLSMNGRPVAPQSIAGGSLSANFEIRDTAAPEAQRWLDGLAADLVARFQAPEADATRTPGAPGLFTDAGAALAGAAADGLAGRLAINALADPSRGGDLWRLRAGLGAATPSPTGDPAGLYALADAMTRSLPPPPGAAAAGPRNVATHAADLVSAFAGRALTSDRQSAHAAGRLAALDEATAQAGVDTDAELQMLLLIERAFAANARVVRAADEMLQQLLRI